MKFILSQNPPFYSTELYIDAAGKYTTSTDEFSTIYKNLCLCVVAGGGGPAIETAVTASADASHSSLYFICHYVVKSPVDCATGARGGDGEQMQFQSYSPERQREFGQSPASILQLATSTVLPGQPMEQVGIFSELDFSFGVCENMACPVAR
jgi:hypothetical protein